MTKYILYFSVIIGAGFLVGCQSTSSTSSSSCSYNATLGYYTDSSGAVCSSSSSTANCVYNSTTGTYINSTTGVVCTTTSTGSCILTSGGYYINSSTGAICSTASASTGYSYGYTTSNGCSYWTAIYGVTYYPAYVNGVLMCVAAY